MEYELDFIKILLIIFVGCVFLLAVLYYYYHPSTRIKNKLKDFQEDPIVKQEVINDCSDKLEWKDQPLAHFQIASSAKSFLIGNQRYDYVSLEMIKQVLLMGARYIELEVLGDSFTSRPQIIVASGIDKGQWQTSLNNIPFDKYIETISQYAFSQEIPTYTLPLFIYIDLKLDENQNAYSQVASILDKHFHDRLIPTNVNLSQTSLCRLFGKVIIWTNDYPSNPELDKIVSTFKPTRYHQTALVEFNDQLEKQEEGRKPLTPSQALKHPAPMVRHNYNNLTVIYPNNPDDIFTTNYPYQESHSYGCQFVALNYQLKDQYLKDYLEYFKTSSIILKSGGLLPPEDFQQEKSLSQMVEEPTPKRFFSWKNLPNEMKNQPIYLRPVGDPRAIVGIQNNRLLIERKGNQEITRKNLFMVREGLRNLKNQNEISLESLSNSNSYLTFDGEEFILDKLSSYQQSSQKKQFRIEASFVPYRGLIEKYQSDRDKEEDTRQYGQSISLEWLPSKIKQENRDLSKEGDQNRNFMAFDQTNDKLVIKTAEDQYQSDQEISFYIKKQPVEVIFHFRSANTGRYLQVVGDQLWANAQEKSEKTIIKIVPGFEAEPELDPERYGKYTHFQIGGRYLRVDNINGKKVLKVDAREPSRETRFLKVNLGNNRIRLFSGSTPLIINQDRTIRVGTIYEEDEPMGIIEVVKDYVVKLNQE